jgi:hypothetical protein
VHDLKLAAVNGDELTIFGEVYIRVQVGKTLLRTRALVVKDLHHALILGNDVMKKYKFISYDDDTLVIKKKTNLVTVQPTKIAPKTTMFTIRLTHDHFHKASHKCPRAHKWPVGHAKHVPGHLWAQGHLWLAL